MHSRLVSRILLLIFKSSAIRSFWFGLPRDLRAGRCSEIGEAGLDESIIVHFGAISLELIAKLNHSILKCANKTRRLRGVRRESVGWGSEGLIYRASSHGSRQPLNPFFSRYFPLALPSLFE